MLTSEFVYPNSFVVPAINGAEIAIHHTRQRQVGNGGVWILDHVSVTNGSRVTASTDSSVGFGRLPDIR